MHLVSVIDDRTGSATEDEMTAVHAYNARLQAQGHWVFAAGLADPHSAPDLDVALRLAAEGSKHCNRRVEVRPCL